VVVCCTGSGCRGCCTALASEGSVPSVTRRRPASPRSVSLCKTSCTRLAALQGCVVAPAPRPAPRLRRSSTLDFNLDSDSLSTPPPPPPPKPHPGLPGPPPQAPAWAWAAVGCKIPSTPAGLEITSLDSLECHSFEFSPSLRCIRLRLRVDTHRHTVSHTHSLPPGGGTRARANMP
jgi:hypothetical protein